MSSMDEAGNNRAHAEKAGPGRVISVLLEQHAKIRGGFAAVQIASGQQRQQAFDQLREMLAVHEAGEEMVLRPVSRKDASAQIADARNKEEDEAAHVLAELEKLDVNSEQFTSKFAGFEKAVSDHAAREESEEFPAVQTAHTDGELQQLGTKLLSAGRKAPTHPHPTAAGSPAAQRVLGPFAALLDKARDAHKN